MLPRARRRKRASRFSRHSKNSETRRTGKISKNLLLAWRRLHNKIVLSVQAIIRWFGIKSSTSIRHSPPSLLPAPCRRRTTPLKKPLKMPAEPRRNQQAMDELRRRDESLGVNPLQTGDPTNAPVPIQRCDYCHQAANEDDVKLLKCSRCLMVGYCSKDCQGRTGPSRTRSSVPACPTKRKRKPRGLWRRCTTSRENT